MSVSPAPEGRPTARRERRSERSERSRLSAPAILWRTALLALLATRALGAHGVPADSGTTVTVTNYRIDVLRGCTLKELGRAAHEEGRTATPEAEPWR
jgi:hypothetical protein